MSFILTPDGIVHAFREIDILIVGALTGLDAVSSYKIAKQCKKIFSKLTGPFSINLSAWLGLC